MDWGKAKRIIVIMLIALNIALFCINLYYDSDYRLSLSEKESVSKILKQNGIDMYGELIDSYEPMKHLDVTVVSNDIDNLKSVFFDEFETVETELEFDQAILRSYSALLISEDSRLSYSCPRGKGELNGVGKDAARRLADDFVEKIGYSNYTLDRITYKNGGYQLEYYEYYNGYKIFCNYCIFFIDDSGIKTIEAENYDINGFVDESREICASSEAILTYIYDNRDAGDAGRSIEDIQIGYTLKESEQIVDGSKIRLVPCYYIYLLNADKPYVVYAYTNMAKAEETGSARISEDSYILP
ncbi:hypothetical protein IMSAG049_00807 [Clostridiales bacterium]|nr:hypothetical protein IMSAG049_00807 [Clostridiales bacterium]